MRRTLASLLALCFAAAACGAAPRPPAAATVNGQAVPMGQYELLVGAARRSLERSGVATMDWKSPTGRDRLRQIEAQALRIAVRDAVIEQMARSHRVSVSQSDLDQTIAGMERTLGGADTFDQRVVQDGLTRDQYRSLLRFSLLDRRLRAADPNYDRDLTRAVGGARVRAYVGPCAGDHDYPSCAGL